MKASSDSFAASSPCAEFQQHVYLYLANPADQQSHMTAALEHLQSCPHCQARVGSLLQGLTIDRDDRLTCSEAQVLLPEYVDAQLLGDVAGVRWQTLQLHLLTCPHCTEVTMELRQLVEEAYRPMSNSRPVPVPDLSFLEQPRSRPSSLAEVRWRMDEWGAVLIEFSRSLLNAFPQPMTVGLKGDVSRKILCRVDLSEIFADLAVSMIAQEALQDPAHCELLIDVDVPSRGGWPHLAGIEVVVRRGDQLLDKQFTDAYGKVVVAGIRTNDLAQLTVQVQPIS